MKAVLTGKDFAAGKATMTLKIRGRRLGYADRVSQGVRMDKEVDRPARGPALRPAGRNAYSLIEKEET